MRKFGVWGYGPLALLTVALSGCGLVNFDNAAVPDDRPEIVDENGVAVDLDKAGDDFLNGIGGFALADLRQAQLLAGDADLDGVAEGAPSDSLAAQCYDYLGDKIELQGDKPALTVSGIVSAFQVARNFRREGGLSDEFKGACGGLIMDVRGQFLKRGVGLLSGGIIG
jgi:hypothetical protein